MTHEIREIEAPRIRGWLLVPLAFLMFWCVWGLFAVVKYLPGWVDVTMRSGAQPGLNHPVWVGMGVALLGLSLYCLIRFLQRMRQARVLVIVLNSLMLAVFAAIYIFPPHHVRGGPVIVAAATIVYFVYSKRVKNTFVR